VLRLSIIALTMRLVGTGVWLVFTLLIARLLSVDDFGLLFLLVSASLVGAQFVLAGYNVVVLREAGSLWHEGNKAALAALVSEARRIIVIMSLLLGLALVLSDLIYPVSALTLEVWRIAFVVALSAVAGLMTLHCDALRSCNQMSKALFGTTVVRTAGSILMLIPLIFFKSLGVGPILLGYLLVLSLAALLEAYWLRQLAGSGFRWKWRFPHFKQSLAIWPGELAMVLMRRSTTLVLGVHNDLGAVAMFVAAERVAMLSDFLTDALRLAIGPNISFAARGTEAELRDACERASALMFVVTVLGAFCTVIVAWPILWLFGDAFLGAFTYVLALIAAQLSWAILGPTALVANMIGLGGARSRLSSLVTAALVLAQVVLFPVFGAPVVVWVLVVATWGLNLALWFMIRARKGLLLGVLGTSPLRIVAAFRAEFAMMTRRGY
jgi:O-antigen/teichoic acid export membrane protein